MLAFLQKAATDEPLWFTLLVLPALALLLRWIRKDGINHPLPHSALCWIPRAVGIHTYISRVRLLLRALATMCLIPIIAGAAVVAVGSRTRVNDRAIMLAIDVSSSMSAEDFAPGNRLAQVCLQVEEFVTTLSGTSIGILSFAAVPELLVPLTREKNIILSALARISAAGYGEDGTAIGSAIASATNRLRSSPAGSRSIILLTDGVNNRGSVSPADAARIARSLGISLNIIGIGTGKVSRFWIPLEQGGTQPLEARIEIDDKGLEELCALAGGRFQRARNTEDLKQAFYSLQGESAEISPPAARNVESSAIMLFAGLALTLLAFEFALTILIYPEIP